MGLPKETRIGVGPTEFKGTFHGVTFTVSSAEKQADRLGQPKKLQVAQGTMVGRLDIPVNTLPPLVHQTTGDRKSSLATTLVEGLHAFFAQTDTVHQNSPRPEVLYMTVVPSIHDPHAQDILVVARDPRLGFSMDVTSYPDRMPPQRATLLYASTQELRERVQKLMDSGLEKSEPHDFLLFQD